MYRLNNDCHFQQEILVKFEKKVVFFMSKKKKNQIIIFM